MAAVTLVIASALMPWPAGATKPTMTGLAPQATQNADAGTDGQADGQVASRDAGSADAGVSGRRGAPGQDVATDAGGGVPPGRSDATAWLFGLLPFESPIALHRRFAGLAEDWATLGIGEVRLESSPDYATHTARLLDQRYDFVYTAPHFAAHHLRRGTYVALAVLDEPLQVAWVERAEAPSPVSTVEEPSVANPSSSPADERALTDWATALCRAATEAARADPAASARRTLRVALPPSEAVIHVVGRAQFDAVYAERLAGCEGQRIEVEWLEMPSHNAALAAVVAGRAELAGVSIFVMSRALRERQPLRLVGRSQPFPSAALLAHTRVPEDVRRVVQHRMVTLHQDPTAVELREALAYPAWRPIEADAFEAFYQLVPWLEFWDGTLQDWRQRPLARAPGSTQALTPEQADLAAAAAAPIMRPVAQATVLP